MFKNYLLIAFRNLKRNKVFSLINLLGLAIGMAVCIFIMLWVQDELSFNKDFDNYKNIHRVIQVGTGNDGVTEYGNSTTPYALGPILKDENPEIILAGRIRSYGTNMLVHNEVKYYVNNLAYIDSDLIDILSLKFISGSREAFINDEQSIFLSQSSAEKFFADENPLDKPLKMNNSREYIVRGVYRDLPENSNIQMEYFVNISLLGEEKINGWSWESSCYVEVPDNSDMEHLHEKINDTILRHCDRNEARVILQPIDKIRLYDPLGEPLGISSIIMLSIIAFIILLIACINFMNLGVARSVKRAREVGIRKVVGANQNKIRYQFLGESILMALFSMLLSLVLVELLMPFFNNLTGKALGFDFSSIVNLGALLFITILVGIGAGSYPALVLSRFRPVEILKSSAKLKSKNWFRTALVIAQFAISVVLIIITLTIFKQISFIQTKDMGFQKDLIYSVDFNRQIRENYNDFKQELLSNPYVLDVTSASNSPMQINNVNPVRWEGKQNDDTFRFSFYLIDPGFINFFEMDMIQGRFFSDDLESDKTAYILNETAIELMGLEDPVGKRFTMYEDEGIIVGIVKDFHFRGLTEEIGPIMLTPRTWWRASSFIKFHPDGLKQGMAHLKSVYQKFSPEFPMRSHFLDSEVENMYRDYYETGNLIKYFAILAIFISCLGLFGLSYIMIQQKTREIGIRKVMGASVGKIVQLFSQSFLRWVLIANLIAIPLGYYFANYFLNFFAFHTKLSISIFLISAIISLLIAFLTTAVQTLQAAGKNPVEALKYE